MQVIVTLAGQGQRFQAEGYSEPKPIVSVMGRPAINYLISTMHPDWKLYFAIGEHYRDTKIESIILETASSAKIFYVPYSSRGPIATVEAVLPALDPMDSVAVSYCDYAMLWNPSAFEQFVRTVNADICVTSYRGFHPTYLGPNTYAHLQVDEISHQILKIQEKKLFGSSLQEEWTSTGFYYFKSASLLEQGLQLQVQKNLKYGTEYYTSLAIQALMEEASAEGHDLKVFNYEISHFLQLGTPTDVKHVEYWYQYIMRDGHQNQFPPGSEDDLLFRYWKIFFKSF
ncbi:MAG: hypothetical protein A2622_06665 [Bdellovibrionales bacterium RIFCSPHIGHO2_01_FULL_40_29]|nr:MAG: hypothetical protein A2622_06665 [Bdellovibrionales bacterium RIFCSPHIGHO2_01_FULL_40_29]OFZ35123.1 MAG: hypothetical protein A3D17_07015 [Bdellovibrionales bacterium RIFCSPHIGHO2_02_FULL_40_15]